MENTEVTQTGEANAQSGDQNSQNDNAGNAGAATKASNEQLLARLKEVSEEAKGYRLKLAEFKKTSELEKRKVLEEQGQFKSLAEIEKQRAEAAEKQALALKSAFATKLKADALQIEAAKLGCVDPDALLHLVDLNAIPINDNFDVDRGHAKTVLEEFKKGKPYLFQKQAPKVPDVNPGSRVPDKGQKPLEKMDKNEIEAALLSGKYK